MRKGSKSELGPHLKQKPEVISSNTGSLKLVIDGGWLLHQLNWSGGDKFNKLIPRIAESCIHGYDNSTKDHKHKRRNTGSRCFPIAIMSNKPFPVSKTKFMSNTTNKARFLSFLAAKMNSDGIESETARDDCDTLNIKRIII